MGKYKSTDVTAEPIELAPEVITAEVAVEEPAKKMGKKKNKIFNNAYNTGDIEFEFFDKIQINSGSSYSDSDFADNSYESYERKNLQEDLYEIFVESNFYEKYKGIKKVPKNDMNKIFYYFCKVVETYKKYTFIELFTEICDFMKMNYKEMYNQLQPTDKQKLIGELDNSYTTLSKRKIKRLF